MRKKWLVLMAAMVLFTACTDNKSEGEATSGESVSSAATTASAAVFEEKDITVDFTYTILNDNVTVTAYTGKDDIVKIPDEIEGFPVTAVSKEAFKGTAVREVVFPESITVVKGLGGAEKLEKITLPSSTETIETHNFGQLRSFKEIEISDSRLFTSKDGMLFSKDMKKLVLVPMGIEKVIIPDEVEVIGEYACHNGKMKEVVFSNNLKLIEKYAFAKCKNLLAVEMPFSLTEIGANAFSTSGLMNLTLNNGLEKIGNYAFQNTQIEELRIPATVTEVGWTVINNDCPVYAYSYIDRLDEYNTEYIGETRLQKAVRKMPKPSEYTRWRVYIDINKDGIPEFFDCGYGLYEFGSNDSWNCNLYCDSMLYEFYDSENDYYFYVTSCSFEVGYGESYYAIIPLKDEMEFCYLGDCTGFYYGENDEQLYYGVVNGKFIYKDASISSEEVFAEAFSEYELTAAYDLNKLAKETPEGHKFSITIGEIPDYPNETNLMTKAEYEEKYGETDDNDYFRHSKGCHYLKNEQINKDSFEKLAEEDVVYLGIYNESDEERSIEGIEKLTNLRELTVNGISDLSALSEMDGIVRLYVSGAENYDFLSGMDGVKILEFCDTLDKPDDFFKVLKEMDSLEFLLVNCWERSITAEQEQWLKENMPDLTVIRYKI